MKTVDVIVPVYGNWPAVQSCLQHLRNQTLEVNVVVVDDHSPDDTADHVEREFPEFRLIRLESNHGFAKACNRGFDSTTGEIVVLVNSDVNAADTCLTHLVSAFDDDKVGSASPVITRPDGLLDAVGLTADVTLAGFVRFHGAPASAAPAVSPKVVGPYGAVAAYRRTSVTEPFFFDPNIFMYGEELDLALRLQGRGWHSVVVADSHAEHEGGASTGKGSARQRRLAGFSRGYLLRKYGVLKSRFAVRALTVEMIVSVSRLMVSRDTASVAGRIEGWRAAKSVPRLPAPISGVDRSISAADSLRMRTGAYWRQRSYNSEGL